MVSVFRIPTRFRYFRIIMKLLTSTSEVTELCQKNVYLRNESELLNKINKIITDGTNKLQIVTDFDHTLTKYQMDDGSIVLTSFGMFRDCPSTPQTYKDEDNRLASIYKPIESDPNMSVEDKTKHMIDWYKAANKKLNGIKFPKEELMDIAKAMKICFRNGVGDLISWSEKKKVPVLVFSAGLGESVVAALEASHYLLPNVKVISNFLEMDKDGVIVGINGVIIHTYNKNEAAIKNTEYYDMVRERNNVILMGDNIGDAGMAEGMEHCDIVIKIGFLDRNTDGNLQNYLSKFDIVLVRDQTFNVTNAILKLLL